MTSRVIFVLLVGICSVANSYLEPQDSSINLLKLIEKYVEKNKEVRRDLNDNLEHWSGRWMPDRPGQPTPPPKVFSHNELPINDHPSEHHRVPMGHVSPDCDDAQTNITIDWDHSPVEHTCYHKWVLPDVTINPMIHCDHIPMEYEAMHKCMDESIKYANDIPLFGTHRPLWPVYGEYKFLPKQRWLHSLEHGAVVMLYHPCANPLERDRLKNLVRKCLRRHIITPYSLLEMDRPLAVLTWGCRLTMSYVNTAHVVDFIRQRALRGPEKIPEDGDFRDALLTPASMVSDQVDSMLCPNM